MKKCPFCAEEIQDEAIKCRYCGEMLDGTPIGPIQQGKTSIEGDSRPLDDRLRRALKWHLSQGWEARAQTSDSELVLSKKKQFSFVFALLWLVLSFPIYGLGALIYVFYFLAKRDPVARLEISEEGSIVRTPPFSLEERASFHEFLGQPLPPMRYVTWADFAADAKRSGSGSLQPLTGYQREYFRGEFPDLWSELASSKENGRDDESARKGPIGGLWLLLLPLLVICISLILGNLTSQQTSPISSLPRPPNSVLVEEGILTGLPNTERGRRVPTTPRLVRNWYRSVLVGRGYVCWAPHEEIALHCSGDESSPWGKTVSLVFQAVPPADNSWRSVLVKPAEPPSVPIIERESGSEADGLKTTGETTTQEKKVQLFTASFRGCKSIGLTRVQEEVAGLLCLTWTEPSISPYVRSRQFQPLEIVCDDAHLSVTAKAFPIEPSDFRRFLRHFARTVVSALEEADSSAKLDREIGFYLKNLPTATIKLDGRGKVEDIAIHW